MPLCFFPSLVLAFHFPPVVTNSLCCLLFHQTMSWQRVVPRHRPIRSSVPQSTLMEDAKIPLGSHVLQLVVFTLSRIILVWFLVWFFCLLKIFWQSCTKQTGTPEYTVSQNPEPFSPDAPVKSHFSIWYDAVNFLDLTVSLCIYICSVSSCEVQVCPDLFGSSFCPFFK